MNIEGYLNSTEGIKLTNLYANIIIMKKLVKSVAFNVRLFGSK